MEQRQRQQQQQQQQQRRRARCTRALQAHTNAFIWRGTSGFVDRRHRKIIFLRPSGGAALNKNTRARACRR